MPFKRRTRVLLFAPTFNYIDLNPAPASCILYNKCVQNTCTLKRNMNSYPVRTRHTLKKSITHSPVCSAFIAAPPAQKKKGLTLSNTKQ